MKQGDSLLDAERPFSSHRISIQPNQKRWWPKTIYHTYWSRVSLWIQRNLLFSFIGLAIISLTTYAIFTPHFFGSESSVSIIQGLRGRFNDPFLINYAPHQDKLRPTSKFNEFLAPDTQLNWNDASNVTLKVKAAFVALVQEEDIYKLHLTMQDIEKRFNHQKGYPWVIISDKLLSRKFREWVTSSTTWPVSFGLAPAVEWQEPYWIDIKKTESNIQRMAKSSNSDTIESMSWRRMTRYNTGFIAHHPLLKDLEYYWKVQAGSRYTCNIPHDPFERMKKQSKKLSFALSFTENHEHLVDFQKTVQGFITKNKDIIQPVKDTIYKSLLHGKVHNLEDWESNAALGDHSGHFSNCMIYNNYMIASLDYLRSKEYTKFFDALDGTGGFFYHKWGDSMPQTLAAALFLKKSEISFSNVPGYMYRDAAICPSNINHFAELRCTCNPGEYKVSNMQICLPSIQNTIVDRKL